MAARIAAQQQTTTPSPAAGQAREQVRELPSTRGVLTTEFGDLVDHAEVPGVSGG